MSMPRSALHCTSHRARSLTLAVVIFGAFLLTACGGSGDDDVSPNPPDDDPTPAQWTKPALLEEENGVVERPQVVVDGADNATAVWIQSDGTNHRVYARRYSAAGALGAVVPLSASGVNAMGPKAGVDGASNVFVVWTQLDGGSMSIQSSIYSVADGSWGAPAALVSGVGNAVDPHIAVDADGTATVVWRQSDPSANQDTYACRFSVDDPCVAPISLQQVVAPGYAGSIDVAAGPDGRAMAVWTARPAAATATGVSGSYFDGVAWHPFSVGSGDSSDPSAGFDAAGNAMIAWAERIGDETATTPYLIHTKRYLAASGWVTGIETLDNGGVFSAENPKVVFDSHGEAVVVWAVDRGADVRLLSNRRSASGWGEAAYIDGGGDTNFGAVMTIDGSDNITVAWESTADYAMYTVVANRYEPATGWGSATIVSDAKEGRAGEVSLASDSRGRAIAVWEQDNVDTTNTNAWFSVYQ